MKKEQKEEWEEYSVKNQGWLQESAYLEVVHPVHRDALHGTIQDHEHDRRQLEEEEEIKPISPFIYKWQDGKKVPDRSQLGRDFAPLWQISPPDAGVVNANLLADQRIAELFVTMLRTNKTILSHNTEIGDMVSMTSNVLKICFDTCPSFLMFFFSV